MMQLRSDVRSSSDLVHRLLRTVETSPPIDFSTGVLRLLLKTLRHADHSSSVSVDKKGWAPVAQILEIVNKDFEKHLSWREFQASDLREFAAKNQDRIEFLNHQIRARYGHSREGVISGIIATPPEFLWHATTTSAAPSILAKGVEPQQRTMVHLTTDVHYACSIHGFDSDQFELLSINSGMCRAAGFQFYKATSHVWQTAFVPPEAISLTANGAKP
jgi:putative RNA 2'-phosphotransferase